MRRVVQRFADRDRHRGGRRQLDVPAQVLGGQRFLEPGQHRRLVSMRATPCFGNGKSLVGVHHHFEVVADSRTHRRQPGHVFRDRRLADLDFAALESLRLGGDRFVDQLFLRVVQPAALRRVHRDFHLSATRQFPQRFARALASQVPQRGVDRSKCQAGDRSDRRRVRREKEILPDRLDLRGVAADEPRHQMIAQQRHDRRAPGADRVRIAHAHRSVVTRDSHERRFLRDEGLDRVGAHDLRWQIDLQDLHNFDCSHQW